VCIPHPLLQGHEVTVYTSHYEAARSFAETRSGLFEVKVHGDWMPRQILGGFHIVWAILRAVWLACVVALTEPEYDVFICDQVSAYVPVLRFMRPPTPVLFYCHFPDQLLSSRGSVLKQLYRKPFDAFERSSTAAAQEIVVNSNFTRGVVERTFGPALAGHRLAVLYPCIDVPASPPPTSARCVRSWVEALVGSLRCPAAAIHCWRCCCGNTVSSENGFCVGHTSRCPFHLFTKHLRRIHPLASATACSAAAASEPIVFLSINRYERKKAIELAIDAFARMRATLPAAAAARVHLVVAGGYDIRVAENVGYHVELKQRAAAAGLFEPGLLSTPPAVSRALPDFPPSAGASAPAYQQVEALGAVTFIRSFSDAQKGYLLRAATAVLYTPSNEHFGIVPIEAMAGCRPVVAVNNGGPLESVVDGRTGYLCEPTVEVCALLRGARAQGRSYCRLCGVSFTIAATARLSRPRTEPLMRLAPGTPTLFIPRCCNCRRVAPLVCLNFTTRPPVSRCRRLRRRWRRSPSTPRALRRSARRAFST
jgi:alpha-1,3/alpha-1,6-mannosyltransferase